MNDDFDERARRWLQDQAEPDPTALRAVVARIDILPPRRRDRLPGRWLAVAAVFVLLLASLPTILGGNAGRGGGAPGSSGASPTPPDPAAFAGDPRLRACFSGAFPVEFVFEMRHARDYQTHFPAMGLAPELDVDAKAFAVVFAAGAGPFPITRAAPDPSASPEPTVSPTPETSRSVCILVDGTPNLYTGVDIAGMTVTLPGEASAPASSSSPVSAAPPTPRSPVPASTVASGPTVAPAPAWAADLLGQLQCDGPPQSVGGETGEVGGETGSQVSPEAALVAFTAATFFTSVPARGYERAALDPHWARFEHRVDGRIKAIVILTDAGPGPKPGGWTVVGLRACDPAEFAPAAGITGALSTVWLDGNDRRVNTTVLSEIVGPEHCGWESTIWLRLDGALFIRDPRGVLRADTVGAYEAHATLPRTARSTGYHDAGRIIWRVPTDADSIYVVSTGGVERWPRATDPMMGCM